MSAYEPVRKLDASDDVSGFDCGYPALNQFLQKHALQNIRANSAQTYVCCSDKKVVGFYTLAVGSVHHDSATNRITKGLAKHPIPVMILARLAADVQHRERGLGTALLKDALLRTIAAADIAGIRCLLVHAKDDLAKEWYSKFDFEISPTDPYQLMLMIKDIKASIE